MPRHKLPAQVIKAAIEEIKRAELPVFTFALYFDHESEALAVCADTESNSARTVQSANQYNAGYFHQYVTSGDLKMARLWQANVGRSLSLGDFSMVNLARVETPGIKQSNEFFLSLVQTLVEFEAEIVSLAPSREKLVLACSGASSEVALVWSASSDA